MSIDKLLSDFLTFNPALIFFIFFGLFGLLLLLYFKYNNPSVDKNIAYEIKLLVDFRNRDESKVQSNQLNNFIDSEELKGTKILKWTREWIRHQERFSEIKHSDFQEYVDNRLQAYIIDYNSISRNLLLLGLAFTFGAIAWTFTKFNNIGDSEIEQFLQSQILPNISIALTSTLAAIIWTFIISYFEQKEYRSANKFSELYTMFLIDDVYPLYPTKDEVHQLNVLTDTFQEVAAAAKEASSQVQSITQVTNLAISSFNQSIDQFINTSATTENVIKKIEEQQKQINQQNTNQEEIANSLKEGIVGLRAIFQLNSDSLESTSGSLKTITDAHDSNFNHVIDALNENRETIVQMNTDLHTSMDSILDTIKQINVNENEFNERLNSMMTNFSDIMGKFENVIILLESKLERLENTFAGVDNSFDESISHLESMISDLKDTLKNISNSLDDYNDTIKYISEEIPNRIGEKMDALPSAINSMNDDLIPAISNLQGILTKMEDNSKLYSTQISESIAHHDDSLEKMHKNLQSTITYTVEDNSKIITEFVNKQNEKIDQLAEILNTISNNIKSDSKGLFERIFSSDQKK